MKERIEEKLGCTIEEFMVRLDNHDRDFVGMETECRSFPDTLSYEELDFVGKYMDRLEAA